MKTQIDPETLRGAAEYLYQLDLAFGPLGRIERRYRRRRWIAFGFCVAVLIGIGLGHVEVTQRRWIVGISLILYYGFVFWNEFRRRREIDEHYRS